MGENDSQSSELNGWYILALVLAALTAIDLFFSQYGYQYTALTSIKCGNGYQVLMDAEGGCGAYRGDVLVRLVVGGGLTWAAWHRAEVVDKERQK